MSIRYQFTCDCGAAHPVETSQAGRSLICSCGEALTIPSMLKIKKLPIFSEWVSPTAPPVSPPEKSVESSLPATEPNAESGVAPPAGLPSLSTVTTAAAAAATVLSATSPKRRSRSLAGNRLGIFLVGLIGFLAFGFFFIQTLRYPPQPVEVFQKRRDFVQNGAVVRRDSSPVTTEDFNFYINEQIAPGQWVVVNGWIIDRLNPILAYQYFDMLKDGPQLSDNFYDNYEALKLKHKMMTVLYGILAVLSGGVIFLPWLLPKTRGTVGTMRGSAWTGK